MARILDYEIVSRTLDAAGLVCKYHRSGAFGFSDSEPVMPRGWIGPADASIRTSMRPVVASVAPPYEENLAALFIRAWREIISAAKPGAPTPLWIMPGSHWAFEMDANGAWLVPILAELEIDPDILKGRTDGAAVEFGRNESAAAGRLVCALLRELKTSDFFACFGPLRVSCLLHHHKQLWWSTTERTIIDGLDRILGVPDRSGR